MPQPLELVVREHLAGAQVPFGAQVELHELDPDVEGPEDLQGLADDLGTGPVPPDHPDGVRPRTHGVTFSASASAASASRFAISIARLTAAR